MSHRETKEEGCIKNKRLKSPSHQSCMVKSGAADEDGEEDGVKVIKHLVVDKHGGNDHWAAEEFASGE